MGSARVLLALLAVTVLFPSVAAARDVAAGPISSNEEARIRCPQVCGPPTHWNGQWRTTVPGSQSVCGCEVGTVVAPPPPPPPRPVPPPPPPPAQPTIEVEAGPIWSNDDAQRKCTTICRPPQSWTGQWRTTIPNRMSVCACTAPLAEVHGMYDAQHREWADTMHLQRDGRFRRGNGDGGSWTFDGRMLVLRWDRWGQVALMRQADGTFFDPGQSFRLVRRSMAPPPPVDRNPPALAGSYDGVHQRWTDTVILGRDGRYQRGNGDGGSWWFENNTLYLKWDRWGNEPVAMAMQPDGSFADARGFRLVRRGAMQAPPPPPPPPPQRSRYLRLDRPYYGAGQQPTVYWDGIPQSASGWLSIARRGAADGEWGDWTYTRGPAGTFSAPRPLDPGDYEVRLYTESMGPVIDRLPFSVR